MSMPTTVPPRIVVPPPTARSPSSKTTASPPTRCASYPCDDANPSPVYNTIAPLWYLSTAGCCEAPTGITVYTGSQISQWQNHLFMAAYNTGALRHFYLNPSRTLVTATNIVQGVTA